ncbi:immunoglobulin superfamily member 1-like isoform X2 [Heterodontus francisci]|uniref:immunoglobulin superfamily member 1-like isoform X2 n=1 Tax=Heterodontus francisci TaxID=7792 RepID=UPI00355BAB11
MKELSILFFTSFSDHRFPLCTNSCPFYIEPRTESEIKSEDQCSTMSAYFLKSFLGMVPISILLAIALLPKPTISLDPQSSVILLGDAFSLVCRCPFIGCNVEFYKNNKEKLLHCSEVNYTAIYNVEGGKTLKGSYNYTCKYNKYFKNNRTWASSPPSEPLRVTVQDKLPKPTVSMDPPSGVVTIGERVQIHCTANYPSNRSCLYKNNNGQAIDIRNVSGSERLVTFTLTNVEPADSGKYKCAFEKTVNGRAYNSYHSESVEITVKDKLPKPTVSMDPPSGVVTIGERVQIHCTTNYPSHRSCLYRNSNSQAIDTRNVSVSEQSVTFTLINVEPVDSAEYKCAFEKMVNGRAYNSYHSDSVEITVKDMLPKANISVDPATGVVRRGEPFRIICKGTILSSGGQFYLYRDGEMNHVRALDVSGSANSVSFHVNGTDTPGTRNYTCSYERIVKQTAYHSPLSDPVQVTVTDAHVPSDQSWKKGLIVAAGLLAAALFAFLILGLAWFCFSRKSAADGHPSDNETEPAVVYASLNTAFLNQRQGSASAPAPRQPAETEACVYAVMTVR